MNHYWRLPLLSLRFVPIWRRNFLVWKKLAIVSMLGNIADPLITIVAFGYGLGMLLPRIEGVAYITFLASGSICMSTMNAANFEALYSAFSRMHMQKTWENLLNTPLELDDIVLAEMLWAATKALLTSGAILLVIALLGIAHHPMMLVVLPLSFFIGMVFASLGLVLNAMAKGYDFFTYYFTLVVTPMTFLSGVYFPVSQLPIWLQQIASFLPLSAAINLVRPIILQQPLTHSVQNVAILLVYLFGGIYFACVLTRRRLLK